MVLAEEDKNRENGSFGPNKLNALYVQVIKRERERERVRVREEISLTKTKAVVNK